MLRRAFLLTILYSIAAAGISLAQFEENFEDGELLSNPPWSGDFKNWSIAEGDLGRRLETRGPAYSDTLTLETETSGPFGTWRFRYGYVGGLLSNFNQVRIYLWVSPFDSETGYYLLVGSNDRTVKLYEAEQSTRTLVAAAADDLLNFDSGEINIRVERDYSGAWSVWLGEVLIIGSPKTDIGVTDDGGTLRIWVKHTSSRGSDHWFDDIHVTPAVESDTVSPRLHNVALVAYRTISVRFTEPVTAATACAQGAFDLNGDSELLRIDCPDAPFTDTLTVRPVADLAPSDYRLTVHGIADPSGNLTMMDYAEFTVEDFGDQPTAGDVIVNEIDFAPAIVDAEFVEILNLSTTPIDLTQVWISDELSSAPVTGRQRVSLPANGYLVLTRDSAALKSRFPDVAALEVSGWPALNNSGDAVSLRIGHSVLDSVAYAALPGAGSGSLERVDPDSPSDLPGNWMGSVAPAGATPGAVNSVYHPDTVGPLLAFVEQTSDVALRAVLTEPIPVDGTDASRFRLGAQKPTVLAPATPRYSEEYFLAFDGLAAGTLEVEDLIDAAGNETAFSSSPLNMLPESDQLIINEIMFEPRVDEFDGLADQAEYIEVWNLAGHPVSLNLCSISGPTGEDGIVETTPIQPALAGLPESGYAIIVDSRPPPSPLSLFTSIPAHRVRRLQSGSLGLRNSGSRVSVWCAGETTDSVKWDPSWHHPDLVESRGISLERISRSAPSNDPRSWTSSLDPLGGTPGRSNSVSEPETPGQNPLEIEPSPFSPDADGHSDQTLISYRLTSDRALVRITVYDSQGRSVRHLTSGLLSARSGSLVWDGRNDRGTLVATGIYIVFLEAADGSRGTVERHKGVVVVARGFN
jgi:hypothetical protein